MIKMKNNWRKKLRNWKKKDWKRNIMQKKILKKYLKVNMKKKLMKI